VTRVCESCGRPLPAEARFCPSCGAPVGVAEPLGERRLVTVLFADLVGSTELSRRLDPERSRDVLSSYFNAVSTEIAAARGQLEKFIGDAVMAVFGVPRTHEDDAVRAVRAGLTIVDRVARLGRGLEGYPGLEVRVGIESGEAAIGEGPAGQLLVTGAVVNAAARLQEGARPGEVLIGETARLLVLGATRLDHARTVEAKGFGDGLVAHPVAGLARRSVRRTIPLVGRGGELGLMHHAFERAVQSRCPHLITVVGGAGMGKSRLVDEFLAMLPAPVETLVGRADTYSGPTALEPVADILRHVAGITAADGAGTVLERLVTVISTRSDAADPAALAQKLAWLLGVAPGEDRDEAALLYDAQQAFHALVLDMAARGPLVIIIDDVHLARSPVLDLVERLTSRKRGAPVLVAVTTRQSLFDDRPSWGSEAHNHALIRLEPLAADDSADLARKAGGGRLGEDTSRHIAERAGGNPFFIVETTGMLLDTAQAAPGPAALPPTVQSVVAARFDHLPDAMRDLVHLASVFLDSFDLEELGFVAEPVAELLKQLEDAEILTAKDGHGRWRFRHRILHDVAYAGLAKRERVRLHMAIADGLDAAGRYGRADHLERAAQASIDVDPSDRTVVDLAVDALIAAGDRARRRMESRRAVDRYSRALVLAGPEAHWGMREGRALAGTGEARYWLAEYAWATDALSQAEQIGQRTNDDWTLAMALRFLGDIVLNVAADVDRAEQLHVRSLAAAERLGDPWVISRSLLFAGWVPWTRDRFDEAEVTWQRALMLARESRDSWVQARALIALSIARSEVDDDATAAEHARAALAIAREMGDQFSTAVAMVQLGRSGDTASALESTLGLFDDAASIFEELGARWELADALFARGRHLEKLERLDDAKRDLHASMRISEELGARALGGWTSRALGRVRQRRGERSAAIRAAEAAEPTS